MHAGLNARQLVAKARLDPVPQQEAGTEKGQGGAEGAGKGDQQEPPQDAEDGAARQGEQGRPGRERAVVST